MDRSKPEIELTISTYVSRVGCKVQMALGTTLTVFWAEIYVPFDNMPRNSWEDAIRSR